MSDELTKVAVAAICGGSLSTWSFMSAISGERTSVGSGRSIAASWYVSDLPEPGRHERERVAAGNRRAHDVLLPGSEGVEAEEVAQRGEEIGQAGEYRSAPRAALCRLRANSAPADVERARGRGRRGRPSSGTLVSRSPGACRCAQRRAVRSGRRAFRLRCRSAPRRPPARRGSSRTRRRSRAVHRRLTLGAVDPTKCLRLADHEVVDPRRGERARGAGPATALDAVAEDDVAQRPAHLVGHGAAQAPSRRARSRHGRNTRIAGCRSSPTT